MITAGNAGIVFVNLSKAGLFRMIACFCNQNKKLCKRTPVFLMM